VLVNWFHKTEVCLNQRLATMMEPTEHELSSTNIISTSHLNV